jgi:hypothetical protein
MVMKICEDKLKSVILFLFVSFLSVLYSVYFKDLRGKRYQHLHQH